MAKETAKNTTTKQSFFRMAKACAARLLVTVSGVAIVSVAAIWMSALCSCKGGTATEAAGRTIYEPEYAYNFRIVEKDGRTAIVTYQPWQGAEEKDSMVFEIRKPAQRVVCMSSSYIAMMDALGETGRVVGVSGMDFITNKNIQQRRAEIGDVGYDGNIDYERLVALKPDLVLLYGISSASQMEGKLRSLGIPYAYIGEYIEETPLGKAEWIVAIGELLGIREQAVNEFRKIEENYHKMQLLAKGAKTRPTVMLNTPYRDTWMMPSRNSYMKRLISDAGAEYIYNGHTTPESRPIDMEAAYLLTSKADFWINVGTIASLEELKAAVPKFADTPPVRNQKVYNSILRATPGGGNDFWESGIVKPDIVLRDMIKMFHPELVADQPFYYYKRLK